ncbi:MAG: hypothetical protein IJQ06_01665 [Paludibacteraceae bacterium]|nr:hypothetical protein [Paludibacteraceae bacterium]
MIIEELQTRREFFKEAALKTLPILSAAILPTLLTGCEKHAGTHVRTPAKGHRKSKV